jgi:hypothetical protein
MLNEHTSALADVAADDFIVLPGDTAYDEARLAWNLAVDQQPTAVAIPESPSQVAAAVALARRSGLRVAPQSTGHAASPMGPLDDALLLKTSKLRQVEIDPDARIARAGGGARWTDVTTAAAEHGLAALSGSSPDVGVVGYTLGGGMSWLARKYGFAANHVRAVELVTAEGRQVRADAGNHPDLFWALRGGGAGNFGVVTAIELELFPIREVFAGMLLFPIERASEVLRAWREWAQFVPDEVTSLGRLLWLPPIDEVPEPMRGRAFVGVEAAALLDASEGEKLVASLRALGPEVDTFATIPPVQLSHLHMDPPQPVPGAGNGMLLDDFCGEAIDAVLGAVGTQQRSPLVSLEVRHLGGALKRSLPGQGAAGSLQAGFAVYSVGMAPVPQAKAAVEAVLAGVGQALAPWESSRTCANFAEVRTDGDRLFGELAHMRLRGVKEAYDPTGLFRANHPVRAR